MEEGKGTVARGEGRMVYVQGGGSVDEMGVGYLDFENSMFILLSCRLPIWI